MTTLVDTEENQTVFGEEVQRVSSEAAVLEVVSFYSITATPQGSYKVFLPPNEARLHVIP